MYLYQNCLCQYVCHACPRTKIRITFASEIQGSANTNPAAEPPAQASMNAPNYSTQQLAVIKDHKFELKSPKLCRLCHQCYLLRLPNVVERSPTRKHSAISLTLSSFTNKPLRMAQLSRASSVTLSGHIELTLPDNDIITIRNPEVEPDMPPVYCVVAATNLSKRSKIPRTDIIEKAKEFLGTTEEPKWYYAVKAKIR